MTNPYYATWKQSESARDQIITILTATLLAQIALYPALARLYQPGILRYARILYIAGNLLANLIITLAMGRAIQ
jgi:hypothetical protein